MSSDQRKAYHRAYYKQAPWPARRADACRRWRERRREAFFAAHGHRCCYCGVVRESADLEIDHKIPRAAGGNGDPGNLLCACRECNRERGDMPYELFCLCKQSGAPF